MFDDRVVLVHLPGTNRLIDRLMPRFIDKGPIIKPELLRSDVPLNH